LTRATISRESAGAMFPWYEVQRQPGSGAKRAAMYRAELEQHAALLERLGYSQAQARQRLAANVAWDFELHGRPKHAAEIERIVDAVYRRGGVASGPPSV
jgi:hypothetical protein